MNEKVVRISNKVNFKNINSHKPCSEQNYSLIASIYRKEWEMV